jgi:hypothetical protein
MLSKSAARGCLRTALSKAFDPFRTMLTECSGFACSAGLLPCKQALGASRITGDSRRYRSASVDAKRGRQHDISLRTVRMHPWSRSCTWQRLLSGT